MQLQFALASVVLACLLPSLVTHAASAAEPGRAAVTAAAPSVVLGPIEVVRRSGVVNCGTGFPPPHVPGQPGDLDIPDEPCRAWYTPSTDQVTLVATHTQARYDRGPNLQSLKHECRAVFNSSWNYDPAMFDDRTCMVNVSLDPEARRAGGLRVGAHGIPRVGGRSQPHPPSALTPTNTSAPFAKSPARAAAMLVQRCRASQVDGRWRHLSARTAAAGSPCGHSPLQVPVRGCARHWVR